MSDRLTTEEAAQELGYHIKHVQKLLRDGVICGEKFGRTWMVPRSEVERIRALQSPGGRFYPDREGTTEEE
jgi:excisionase family DNA binding protein